MDAKDLRFFGCDIIQTSGIRLRLPQTVMTTAQMLFQRVYHTKDYTFDKYPLDITAMAALFLASKVEDEPRKSREVIEVFTNVISRKFKSDIILQTKEYDRVKDDLITTERRILKNLGFDICSNYPHKILITYYNAIVNRLDPDFQIWQTTDRRRIFQRAWNYCNDSLRTDIFTKLSKEAIVFACVQMACEDMKQPLPKSSDGRFWYGLFIKDEANVLAAISILQELYKHSPPDPKNFKNFVTLTKYQINESKKLSR